MQPHPQAIPLGSKPLRVELGEGEAPGEQRVPGSLSVWCSDQQPPAGADLSES